MKIFIFQILLFFVINLGLVQAQNWQKLDTEPYSGKQDDIYFIDENTGWYVNGYGKIYKTTNGGKTWEEIDLCEDAQARQFGIGFIDENIGYVGTMRTKESIRKIEGEDLVLIQKLIYALSFFKKVHKY